MGLFKRKPPVVRVPAGYTMLIGLEPNRKNMIVKFVRATPEGKLLWTRGKEDPGEVVVQEGTAWEMDSGGRAFILDRRTLQTYGVNDADLAMVPDDGWTIQSRARANHEQAVANTKPADWMTMMVKYTPILVGAVVVICLVGFTALLARGGA